MKTYWKIYFACLVLYIAFNVIFIDAMNTMPVPLKVGITLGLVSLLAIYGFIKTGIRFLWASIFSISFWAFNVNTWLGLMLHNQAEYKSDSFPDNLFKTWDTLYWVLIIIVMVVSSGMLYYTEVYKKKKN